MCVSRPSRSIKGTGLAGLLLVVLAVWQVMLVQSMSHRVVPSAYHGH